MSIHSAHDGTQLEMPIDSATAPPDRPDGGAVNDAIRAYRAIAAIDRTPGILIALARHTITNVEPDKQAEALMTALRRIRAGADRIWPRRRDGRFHKA